jgi:hypothetical protein
MDRTPERKPVHSIEHDDLTVVDRATSGPGSVVRIVNASPVPSGIGRHKPAKQNQSSPNFVNRHFDLGDLVP